MSNNKSYLPAPTKRDEGQAGESGTGNHGPDVSRARNTSNRGAGESSAGGAGNGTGSGSSVGSIHFYKNSHNNGSTVVETQGSRPRRTPEVGPQNQQNS